MNVLNTDDLIYEAIEQYRKEIEVIQMMTRL